MGQITLSTALNAGISKADIQENIHTLTNLKAYAELLIEKEKARLKELDGIKPPSNKIKKKVIPYNPEWGWATKARYIIKSQGKLLTLQEILTIAEKRYEPDLKNDEEEYTRTKSNLAGQLKLNLEKDFYRIKLDDNVKYFYYGLKSWFDDNGEPLAEYLPE